MRGANPQSSCAGPDPRIVTGTMHGGDGRIRPLEGGGVGVTMFKDLIATVQREKAKIGIFITPHPPTRVMLTETVSAGFYERPDNDRKVPKIQIFTIEELMNGKRPDI